MTVGFAVMGLASLSALGYMLNTAISMVLAGRGLETYRTFWLVEFNWLSFLILCACTIIALLIAVAFRLYEYMQWRSLEKKYGLSKDRQQPTG